MAPVVKRFTISLAGSTSSSGTGVLALADLHQPAQSAELPALVVDEVGELFEGLGIIIANRMLQLGDGLRIQQMMLAADAVLIAAADSQLRLEAAGRVESVLVLHLRFARKHLQPHAFHARCGSGEIFSHQRPVKPNGLEYLRPAIALQGRDAHLGGSLQQAFVDGLGVILQRRFKRQPRSRSRRSSISSSVSMAKYGFTALAPYPISKAKCITSRGSPDSMINATCVRSLLADQMIVHRGQRQQATESARTLRPLRGRRARSACNPP